MVKSALVAAVVAAGCGAGPVEVQPDAEAFQGCAESVAHYYDVGCNYISGGSEADALDVCTNRRAIKLSAECEAGVRSFLLCTQDVQPFDPATANGCFVCRQKDMYAETCK